VRLFDPFLVAARRTCIFLPLGTLFGRQNCLFVRGPLPSGLHALLTFLGTIQSWGATTPTRAPSSFALVSHLSSALLPTQPWICSHIFSQTSPLGQRSYQNLPMILRCLASSSTDPVSGIFPPPIRFFFLFLLLPFVSGPFFPCTRGVYFSLPSGLDGDVVSSSALFSFRWFANSVCDSLFFSFLSLFGFGCLTVLSPFWPSPCRPLRCHPQFPFCVFLLPALFVRSEQFLSPPFPSLVTKILNSSFAFKVFCFGLRASYSNATLWEIQFRILR